MSPLSLSVLIPAAGSSKRLGQAKQLICYKGQSLIQHAITLARSVDPGEIIVVTGANAGAVKAAVTNAPTRWIHNPRWLTGMGGSISLGASSIAPDSTGIMILLCDQWCLQSRDLQELAATWRSNPERIVVARAEGKYMPPVIFPGGCFEELYQLTGDQGARKVIENHPDLITPVHIENAAFDLNTQAQLETLNAQ